jgi:hypothetical protein
MKIKDLKKMIENLPDDTPIVLINGTGRGGEIEKDWEIFVGKITEIKYDNSTSYSVNFSDKEKGKKVQALIINADW